MRIRRIYHQRRMMCLFIMCAWSMTTMLFLWKEITEKDGYKTSRTMREQENIEIADKKTNREITPTNKQKTTNISELLKGLIQEEKSTKLQKSKKRKSRIDYGRNRDVDIEGVNDYMMWYENFQNTYPQLPTLSRQQKCSRPIQNIAFLKTHFTGSDVITNILNRYGDLNNLNVALPSDGLSTFFWPMRFQWKYIDITLLNGSLPNIISNHARYNNDVMDNILDPGSVYVTILRDPVTQLETTFNNLGFGGLLQVTNTTDQLKKFLENPKFYIQGVVKRKRFKDTLNLIKNGQFFDLGLPTTQYHRKDMINTSIRELYEKFSLVLIYEHLDESLVLMKRKLCWQLDDILYLKFHHANPNIWNRGKIPDDVREMVKQWNAADVLLYNFFNKTLWEEIKYEGDSFWKELKEFKSLQSNIEKDCLHKESEREKYTLADIPTEVPLFTVKNPIYVKKTLFVKTSPAKLMHLKKLKSKRDLEQSKEIIDITDDKNNSRSFENKTLSDILFAYSLNDNKRKLVFSRSKYNLSDSTENNEYHDNEENKISSESNSISIDAIKKLVDQKALAPEKNTFDGSGFMNYKPYTEKISNRDRMLSRDATPWNKYLCQKLIMSELEYLDYFRQKHTYAKAEVKNMKSIK